MKVRSMIPALLLGVLAGYSGPALAASAPTPRDGEIVSFARGSYPVWSVPPDSMYRTLEATVDRRAAEICGGEAERIGNYSYAESYEKVAKVMVTVSALFQCK